MRIGLTVLLLLSSVAEAQRVPAPREVLGFEVGADRTLADWGQITDYFTRLAASPAVDVDTLGRTTNGQPFLAVTISHPDNMRRLEEIRAREARLADPRQLSPGDEADIVRTQPAVLLISANIHATEIASSQMVMELAHRLATNDTLQAVLKDVVVLVFPSMNPDGQRMITEWYRRNLGTQWEGGPLPWLYHPYVGHDNNRDWYMVTQKETRLATDFLYRRWFPQVVYDIHQMGNGGMRIFVPPMVDPINPNLDPLIVRGINLIGAQMSWALEQAGKQGVGDGVLYDLWWHGGFRSTPTRHNMIALLTEAASVRIATPITQKPEDLRGHSRGLPRYEQRISFPNPWPGGTWRLRDIVDYELIAAEALVKFASRYREELVRGFVEMGRRQIAAGAAATPRAFIIPKQQHDDGATRSLLEVLQTGGVEIHDAPGAWVVRLDQPYRAHAKDLLEPQRFPAIESFPGGPVERPYDVAGWTLPMQMGVRVIASDSMPSTGALLAPVETMRCVTAESRGAKIGKYHLLDARNTSSYRLVMQALRAGRDVRRTTAAFNSPSAGASLAAGSFVVARQKRSARDSIDTSISCLPSLDVIPGTDRLPRTPRIALYKPWTASMDEGWTRWVLERFAVPFASVADSAIKAGRLRDDFDVLLVPDMSLRDARSGMSATAVPPPYAGGLGDAGLAEIKRFVEEGGTLVLLDHAAEIGTSVLGVPVNLTTVRQRGEAGGSTGAEAEASQREALYAPGSILRVLVNGSHRVTAGMPDTAAVYFTNSVTFDVPANSTARVLLRYPERGADILLSGFLQGAQEIAGKAAAVDAPLGRGRVIMFGFRPQYRGQSHGTFKLLFNALLAGRFPEQR